MKEWFVEAANDFVNSMEDSYVFYLMSLSVESEDQAEKCACPQCKKHAKSVENRLANEIDRLSPREQLKALKQKRQRELDDYDDDDYAQEASQWG